MKTIEKMKRATSDEDVQAILEYREKAVRDETDRISFAHEKGIRIGEERGIMIGEQRGEQKGKELERINIAMQMLSHGINFDTISAVTGLSKEDLLKLKQ